MDSMMKWSLLSLIPMWLALALYIPSMWSLFYLLFFSILIIISVIMLTVWGHVSLSSPHQTSLFLLERADKEVRQLEETLKEEKSNWPDSTKKSHLPVIFGRTVDGQLQLLIDNVLRDFILKWLRELSHRPEPVVDKFKEHVWGAIQNLYERMQRVDAEKLIAGDMTTRITQHFERIRIAQCSALELDRPPVFALAPHLLSCETELHYLRQISELIIMFLMPRCYSLTPASHLVREILACKVLQPAIDLVTEPDYINQKIIHYLEAQKEADAMHVRTHEYAKTFEDYIRLINSCNNVDTLKRLRYDIVTQIMQATTLQNMKRAKGIDVDALEKTAPQHNVSRQQISDAKKLKRYIGQLTIAKSECENALRKLGWDGAFPTVESDSKTLPLHKVMESVTGRRYLSMFLEKLHSQGLVGFWSAVEELRHSPRSGWHQLGAEIFYTYIRSPSAEIKVDKDTRKRMEAFLLGDKGPEVFYEVQDTVVDTIQEKYYHSFLMSEQYKALIAELATEEANNKEIIIDRSPIEDRQLSNDSASSADSALHLNEHSTYARRKLDQLQERHNNKTQVITIDRSPIEDRQLSNDSASSADSALHLNEHSTYARRKLDQLQERHNNKTQVITIDRSPIEDRQLSNDSASSADSALHLNEHSTYARRKLDQLQERHNNKTQVITIDRSPIEDRQLSNDSASSADSALHLNEHSTYARRKLDQLQERHNNKTQVITIDRSPIEDRQLSNDSASSADSALHLNEHSTYARRKLDQLQERHNNKTQVITIDRSPIEDRQLSNDSASSADSALHLNEHSTYARRKLDQLQERHNNKTQALAALRASLKPESPALAMLANEVERLAGEQMRLEAHLARTDTWAEHLGLWRATVHSAEVIDESKPPQFVIVVHMAEKEPTNEEKPEQISTGWVLLRTLNEFQELHRKLRPMCNELKNLELPSNSFKFLFGKNDKNSLEKAKTLIQKYLEFVLEDDRLNQSEALYTFLNPSTEYLKQGDLPKKNKFSFSTLFKSTSSETTKSSQDKESFAHLSADEDEISLYLDGNGGDGTNKLMTSSMKGAGSLSEERDSIAEPLYALLSEVFDMRGVFRWLRKTLVTFVQITYGRTINRQIKETISWLFSEQMLHYYIGVVLKSWWPGGVLSETHSNRNTQDKEHTRVLAQQQLSECVVSALSGLVGEQAAARGAHKLFLTLQHATHNKQLFYELFELVLLEVFPELKRYH